MLTPRCWCGLAAKMPLIAFILAFAVSQVRTNKPETYLMWPGRSAGSTSPEKKGGFAKDDSGASMPSLTASMTDGKKGNIILRDSKFLDHMAHFDRERIPERVVHAKGHGAHGTFEVTHDITKYSKACVFKPGTKVPILMRFSTVGGSVGSADTAHDPRGFAIKFYTDCGVWDIAGNNIEIFIIRDPMLFAALNRSRKKHPVSGLGSTISWWDFTSLRPETTFHTLQLFSYLGYPDGSRFMDGAGVHAFKLVSASKTAVYCKFHFIGQNGYKNHTPEQAAEATKNPDYAQADLYYAIEKGEHPSWELNVQIMTYEQAKGVSFDPFDATKIWPRDQFPLQPVGKMTLNRNPGNYFQEIEMAAFSPANLIPGIEPSPDRLLHGRMFSYHDAQRYRLGVNFRHLPINRPKFFSNMQTYSYDGVCNSASYSLGPNYFPNSLSGAGIDPDAMEHVDQFDAGDVIRNDLKDDDNFSQATAWYKSRPAAEQQQIATAIGKTMIGVPKHITDAALCNFDKVDKDLAKNIRDAAGIR